MCLCCSVRAHPNLPDGVLCAINNIAAICSNDVYHNYILVEFPEDDLAKCIKFLEYLYKTKCDPFTGWQMGESRRLWDAEVLKAMFKYNK